MWQTLGLKNKYKANTEVPNTSSGHFMLALKASQSQKTPILKTLGRTMNEMVE